MKTLIRNIRSLLQVRDRSMSFVAGSEMSQLPAINHAFLLINNGLIESFGQMDHCPKEGFDSTLDASNRFVLPTWCDSHTHIVYAGNRENEFVDRIKGLTYAQIAEKGGGILNSAKVLQKVSEDDLYEQSCIRVEEVISLGTGAVEIKSGYGLTPEAELKMLRVIKRLQETYSIPVKATFLAAHALPTQFVNNREDYIKKVIEDLLPRVEEEELADYIDVFCETGYFTVKEMELILSAGRKAGLVPKVHVNQFSAIGGVQAAVHLEALSVDHLEVLDEEDIDALQGSMTMPVALPGCSYFLGIPYTPARKLIDAGLPVALATDYNPGSAPSGNMHFTVSAGCIKMKMMPEEAINAATLNGAYAMGLENEVGSISIGKRANLIITKPLNSYTMIPYSFGSGYIEKVLINGQEVTY